MDWKQFIVSLVSGLAWPATVITFLFFFKEEISKIIQRLAHLKYKDLEMDFGRVKQYAEELKHEISEEKPAIESPVFRSLEDQILDAVERVPSAAVLLAWSGLETAIASAVSRLAISSEIPSYRSPMHNIEMIARNGRLSKTHEKLLHEMRTLRNKVAHGQETMVSISEDQALSYANTAIELIKHFEDYKRID